MAGKETPGDLPFDGRELDILRAAAESLHDALVIAARDGTILHVNPAFEKMTGWSEAEVLGKTPRVLRSGAHPDEFYRELWATILGGEQWRGRILNRRRDGEIFPQDLVITPILDATGRVTHFVSAARDVSEQLQSLQESVAKQEVFEQILQSLGDVSFLVDIRTKRFLYVSPMYERMVGYPGKEILVDTKAALKPVHPDDVARIGALLEQAAFEGDMEVEYRVVRPDGAVRHLQAKAWLVRDVQGEPARFAGTLRDVTEVRAKERELAKSEALFLQSQKMEAVGRLAGGVAHDFNNMLTAILGYGELLEDELAEQGRLRTSVEEIVKAGRRAADLTKRLLAFSRKQVLAPEALDLGAVVRDVEVMLRRLIGEDVALEVTVGSGIPLVHADRGQLEQVLMNLAVNARDAMPDGGKLLIAIGTAEVAGAEVEALGVPAAGRYVKLSVTDTGTGMTEEVKSHLFEPFYTTKAPGQGTGLGLATVHGILRQSGGGIGVRSAPGRGATFDAYLPISRETARRGTRTSHGPAPVRRGAGTILVAEDEDLVRRLVVETLAGAGYHVLAAPGGREAVEMAAAEPGTIRLLISDVVMPGMGGLEAARLLKEARPGIKVLFMSGYTNEGTVSKVLGSTGTEYLNKPFSPKVLLERVDVLLQG